MPSTKEIIPDSVIRTVHANADFGSMTPRDVIDEGVYKYAFGFTGGSTQCSILLEHKLITGVYAGCKANLTAKGKRYARALVNEGRIQLR